MTALFFCEFRMRHVAKHADAIVEVDKDGAPLGHVLAAVIGHARRTECPATTVYEDNDRAAIAWLGFGRCPEVEVEAVFTGRLFAEVVIDVVGAQHLNAFGTLAVGVPDAVPADWLRRPPAQVAGRRISEWDSQIGLCTGFKPGSRDLATGGCYRIAGQRPHRICENQCGRGEQSAR